MKSYIFCGKTVYKITSNNFDDCFKTERKFVCSFNCLLSKYESSEAYTCMRNRDSENCISRIAQIQENNN